jgi:hypothetical protein
MNGYKGRGASMVAGDNCVLVMTKSISANAASRADTESYDEPYMWSIRVEKFMW